MGDIVKLNVSSILREMQDDNTWIKKKGCQEPSANKDYSFLETEPKIKTRFPKERGRNARKNTVENRINKKITGRMKTGSRTFKSLEGRPSPLNQVC